MEYELELKNARDLYSEMKSVKRKGREEGRVEGARRANVTVVKNMYSIGFSSEEIARILQFSIAEVELIIATDGLDTISVNQK